MSQKEIKSVLKQAREAIRQKEYKEAIKFCKEVLKTDKDNYNALVFVGVAADGLNQSDQALKAFEKAIQMSPDQLLAWQGLCSMYEKTSNTENQKALIPVYERLLKLTDSSEKKMELMFKLGDLYSALKQVDKAVQIYRLMLDGVPEKDVQKTIWIMLVNLLENHPSLNDDQQNMLLEAYRHTLVSHDLDLLTHVKFYLNLLQQRGDLPEFRSECERLFQLFPESVTPVEYLIQIELNAHIGVESLREDKICELLSKLPEENNTHKLGTGFIKLYRKDFKTAEKLLKEGTKAFPDLVAGHVYLAESLLALSQTPEALQICNKALCLLSDAGSCFGEDDVRKIVEVHIHSLQVHAWTNQNTYDSLQKAENYLTKLLANGNDDLAIALQLGNVFLKQGKLNQIEELLMRYSTSMKSSSELLALKASLEFAKGNYTSALSLVETASCVDGSQAQSYILQGRICWELGHDVDQSNLEKAFNSWLKAAKLDPFNSEVFLLLGDFYSKVQHDQQKARRCYQKSFNLKPDCEKAGTALCDCLTAIGDQESVYALLQAVTNGPTSASQKWAWVRLGLYQVRSDHSSAVTSFQTALRADPQDNHVWECLGEAYYKRGSIPSALKAFSKALELEPSSLYCIYQIAFIKQTLGQLVEAVEEYKLLLQTSTDYVPALKGLGETLLLLAKSHLRQSFDKRAILNCTEAIHYLTKAASLRPDLSSVWKLIGDACTMLNPLSSQDFSVNVPSKLTQQGGKDVEKCTSLSKEQLLQLGARCYGQALKLLPDCASLWHDLAVNYYHQSLTQAGEAGHHLALKALQVLQKAVTLDPLDYRHWTALGRICCHPEIKNYSLAQHCFIKSIQNEKMNVVAWTNLGTLYLMNENIQLAHEAFTVAQSIDPTYVACWIGQAMIAEQVGHDDAMDLFRHTTELAHHLESALGYSNWVCNMMNDMDKKNTEAYRYCIEQMAAVPMAIDALTHYLDRVKTNATAYNMYGLLLEKQGLLKTSAAAFQSALNILEKTSGPVDQIDQVRTNYARILSNSGQFVSAILQYKAVTTTTFPVICGLALAYYKQEEFPQSYEAYQKCLELASNDEERSHVYAAIGMVLYKLQDTEAVKTALFQCSQISPPSNQGLAALCSFGFLQSDSTLLKAALQELVNKKCSKHFLTKALFSVALHLLEGDVTSGAQELSTIIEGHPNSSALLDLQSTLQLQIFRCDYWQTIPSSFTAISLEPAYSKSCYRKESLGLLACGERDWLPPGRNGRRTCLRQAQKAVHLFPDMPENLVTLVTALHSEMVFADKQQRRTELLQTEQRMLSFVLKTYKDVISVDLKAWLCGINLISLVINNKLTEAEGLIQANKDIFETSNLRELVHLVKGLKSKERTMLEKVISESSASPFLCHILAAWLVQDKNLEDAERIYQLCISNNPGADTITRAISLTRLCYLAFCQIKRDGNGHWRAVFDKGVEELCDTQPTSPVLLMQALLCLRDNPRLCKRYLNQVLEIESRAVTPSFIKTYSRKLILKILKEKNDQQAVEAFLKECEEAGDTPVVKWFQANFPVQKPQPKPVPTPETEPIDQWDNC